MKKKIWFSMALAGFATAMLTACGGGAAEIEYDSVDAAMDALNQAQTIYIAGDYDAVSQSSDILADDKVAAHLDDKTVSIDGETWFSFDFVTDEWINENGEDYITSTTYGYYDADGNCLGYAQKRSYNDDEDYYYYLTDDEGNLMPYYIEQHGRCAYDEDGNVIATAEWSVDFKLDLTGGDCHVQIDKAEDASIDMDFMDKLMMWNIIFGENQ